MSNRTVFKIPELRREYRTSIQDMLDQKQNIESLILGYGDTKELSELMSDIDLHIKDIEKLIEGLPKVDKVREKDSTIVGILITNNDDHIRTHFALAEKINKVVLPIIKDLIPDDGNELFDVTHEVKKGL